MCYNLPNWRVIKILLSEFDYELPESLIAQTPIEPRNASRFMILNPATKEILHERFYDLKNFAAQSAFVQLILREVHNQIHLIKFLSPFQIFIIFLVTIYSQVYNKKNSPIIEEIQSL